MSISPEEIATPRRSLRKNPIFWAVVSLLVLAGAFLLDDATNRAFGTGPYGFGRACGRVLSKAGEGWVIAVAGCGIAAILAGLGRGLQARLALLVTGTSLLTGLAGTILRAFAGRTRPMATVQQGFYGIYHDSQWIIGQYDYSSFPSGHAATVAGLVTAVWLINPRVGAWLSIYAMMVCWARMATYSHHLSDIVAGSIVGIFGAWWIVKSLRPRVEAMGRKP